MSRLIESYEQSGILPEMTPGEIVHQTEHYCVVTDFKPGMEGDPNGARFFIELRDESKSVWMLFEAAKAHNIYNFNIRPVSIPWGIVYLPSLRADYIPNNIHPLIEGRVEIPVSPRVEDHTIPSPDRMETCLKRIPPSGHLEYTFVDGEVYQIPDPMTRQLRLLLNVFSDEIPSEEIHGNSAHRYFKVRRNWFHRVVGAMEMGIRTGEFKDSELVSALKEFLYYIVSDEFRKKPLTTKDDIEWANSLIRKITG